ncbi:MAG: hypothetical protein K5871_05930 [Lachnospiraceae bacterium]|nr:hypothetical protein [Lachnospiraceae bacterium]
MNNRALLIYAPEDIEKNKWFADRLVELASDHGIRMKMMTSRELKDRLTSAQAVPGNGLLSAAVINFLDCISFVINRSRDEELSLFFEKHGIPSYNNSETVRLGNDKLLEHGFFRKLGLPVMETACGDALEEEIPFGPPFIVKHRRGHGGSQVFKAGSYAEALELMGPSKDKWIIQKMCDEPGCDLRLYMLGGRVIAGVLRRSEEDFRSNFSLGGKAELISPDPGICGQAEKIAESLGADYIGIDLIRHGGSFVFNEIEDAVGARMLYEVTDLDVAGMFMKHIYEKTFQN